MQNLKILAALLCGAFLFYISTAAVGTEGKTELYTEKSNHYEVTIEGERVEIAKDSPKVKLNRWGGEETLTVKKSGAFKEVKRDPNSPKKLLYEGEETIVVEALTDEGGDLRDAGTNGEEAVKIDFLLDKKPKSNVFTLELEGWERLNFFYQPELTPEQVERGDTRPENIVGSYAVYHQTKRNNQVGGNNYQAGKLFHIYRPKIVGANGAWVWGQLGYDEGILSVTVPQDFLDSAVYPVRVDPTFGYTTAGATAANIANSVNDASIRWGNTASSTAATATVYSLHASLNSNYQMQTVDVSMFLNRESVSDNLS